MTLAVSYSPQNGSQLTLPTGDSGRHMRAVSDLLLPRFLWGADGSTRDAGTHVAKLQVKGNKTFRTQLLFLNV